MDGGPDENPHYQKTIECAIDYFSENDLDALFLAANAPGKSAFNRVERCMAPLCHDLAGVIFPHVKFGTHLNSNGNTVDEDLELKNFAYAGELLAEMWSDTVINGHPTVSECIGSEAPTFVCVKDQEWKASHVRESQYCLQIVKCKNAKCCMSFRSSLLSILCHRFLPPPLPIAQSADGVV